MIHSKNQWQYANNLMEQLTQEGVIPQDMCVAKRANLRRKLESWSEVNFEIYGYFHVDTDRCKTLLKGVLAEQGGAEELQPMDQYLIKSGIEVESEIGGLLYANRDN